MAIRCETVQEINPAIARFDRPIAIVIPAYNEGPHLEKLLARCAAVKPRLVLVVDDGSKDDTQEVLALELLKEHGFELVVLRNDPNLGKQGSVLRGLQALKERDDIEGVALIDGDGQHDPNELPALASLLDQHEMVIGARSHAEMPLHRQFSNALVNIGFLAIGGVDFSDVQSGLRIYKKELSDVLAEKLPSAGGYGLEHESLSVLARFAIERGSVVRAVAAPASCAYGEAKSKMKPADVIELAYQTVRHAWRIRLASLEAA